MIKSSGFNVYPAQVEDVLYKHPDVLEACVIGVPDEEQVQKVKAFVVLKDPNKDSKEMEAKLINYCNENLIKWSCPREIEFSSELPKTLVGKIDFKQLEQQEKERSGDCQPGRDAGAVPPQREWLHRNRGLAG